MNPNHDPDGKFSAAKIMSSEQPLAMAYMAGADAYKSGMKETEHLLQPPHSDEFVRGYRVARKDDRFKKTIEARKKLRSQIISAVKST